MRPYGSSVFSVAVRAVNYPYLYGSTEALMIVSVYTDHLQKILAVCTPSK
jgi:hypothetical protein